MASDDLRARVAAVLASHEPVPGMWDCTCGARTYDFGQHRADAVLAVVQPELDREAETSQRLFDQRKQMAAERYVWQERGDRYRAAWMGARNRAQGIAQRYRYERKLCDAADLRATKAIRKQLAVEAERDAALAALQAVRESHSLGEALAAVAKHDALTVPALAPQMTAEDVRGGFWPDLTGGRCSPCHLATLRGYEPEPDCPDCEPTTKESER